MTLSKELEEAVRPSGARYFFVRTRAGKTVGGSYPTLDKLVAGIQRAIDRGLDRNELVVGEIVKGEFQTLSVDETEAVLAGLE